MRQLLRFGRVEGQCCLFAALCFLGLGLVRLLPLPVDAGGGAAGRDETDVGPLHGRTASLRDAARVVLRPHRFFLWAAENAATFLRAWQCPSPESVWTPVHPVELGSWSLLVVVSIVLVAAVKACEGRLYGSARDRTVLEAVTTPRRMPRPVVATGPVRHLEPSRQAAATP